jgi:hypothetical protein
MTVYKIERFDVAIFGDSLQKVPIIYIKPDLDILEFSNYLIECEINGTGKEYDGKNIVGVISSSEEVPSKRPIFFKKYGLYVVTLLCNWYGYPDDLSSCSVTFYLPSHSFKKPDNYIQKDNYNQKDNYIQKDNYNQKDNYIHRGPIKEDFSPKKIHKKEPNKNVNPIKIITLVVALMIIIGVIYFLIKQNISLI